MNSYRIQKLGKVLSDKVRAIRREILENLVSQIEEGKFDSLEIDPNKLYMLHVSVRREYQSPLDISGYNWGAMRSSEIGAGYDVK